MSSPPPTKPPRGVKQGKETSGLLMSVIRTLSASETNELREKERAKLEKEYKKSDAKLDELVAAHASDIMEVMQKFSQTTAALGAWGTRCDAAVARLAACRSLLQLRRDDLTRLWADSRTHHHALQMLTDIERVVVSEREVHSAMAAGRVLGAASTLRGALQAAGSTLERVTALHHTRDHLESKKRELVDMIVKRLGHAVYRGDPAPLSRRPSRRRTALLLAELMKTEEVTEAYMQDITPEFESSLLEEDKTFETNVMISLEALGMLEQLKEGAESFKVQIQGELLEVIDAISRRIIEEGDVEVEGEECEQDGERPPAAGASETGRPLVRLIGCLGDEFRAGASRNKRLLQLWRATLQRYQISDSCLHTEQHYWSAVQQVLQLLLTEYLEIESVTQAARSAGAAAGAEPALRVADYFARRRPPRRRARLYALPAVGAASATAMPARAPRYRLVCRAAPAHLRRVLPALHALCRDTEAATGGGECSLRAFITNYVREGEAERLASTARAAIDAAMKEPGAWREKAPPVGGSNTRGGPRLIFASCNVAWAAVGEAARAARLCGACGGGAAARAAVAALAALAAHCRHAHAHLAPSPPHPARAARWLSDDDIVRFLQSLPNWRVATAADPVTEDKQLEQELKQAYEREAEILGSSLGDGAVERREIVADVSALAEVALLCETMDWLSANIKTLPQLLSGVKLSEKLLADMAAAACIFDEITHKCLLFLHLEVRIQCFHYLGQEGGATEEGAGGAARLAQALLALHELVSPLLAPRRLAYIMNGVGEMMSAAVILRWQWGAASSARLATLRHCLAALHLPHVGLHSAHNYLRLLAVEPQEIIDRIKEKGPEFSELEYLNAFKAIAAKRGLSQSDLKPYLKQLADALGTIGVTV